MAQLGKTYEQLKMSVDDKNDKAVSITSSTIIVPTIIRSNQLALAGVFQNFIQFCCTDISIRSFQEMKTFSEHI